MYRQPPPSAAEWQGFPVQLTPSDLNSDYLKNICLLLLDGLLMHSRWTVIRFDLKAPRGFILPQGAITGFIESLKRQLEHDQSIKPALGGRAYDPMLRYVWVREWNDASQPHYHLALMLNRDAYFTLGDYSKLHPAGCNYDEMLAGRIYKAWGVALGLDWFVARSGVHFPQQPVSPLKIQHQLFERQYQSVFYRLSYFAKKRTKVYGDGQRNFGMSQLSRLKTEFP